MKKLKYILFTILLIVFITPRTFAYQNTSTSYDIITQDYNSMLSSQTCNNTSLLDYFQYIINNVDWASSYYQVFTTLPTTYNVRDYNGYKVSMYLIPTTQIQNDYLLYRGTNNANQVGMSYQYGFNISPYYNTYNRRVDFQISVGVNSTPCNLNTIDYQNDIATLNLIDLLQNNHITTSGSNYLVNDYVDLSFNNSNSTYASFFEQNSTSISNNSSYNTTLWYYYSSFKYRYIPTDMSSNTFWYYKNINLINENKSYTIGDYFDSYFDLHTPIESPQFYSYNTELQTLYTNLIPSLLNNYQLKVNFTLPYDFFDFFPSASDYLDNIKFDYVCSGRVNHNGYYSYESFPCSLSYISLVDDDERTIHLTFNNVTISQSLTNYDKLYITIIPSYIDDSYSKTIYDFSYSYLLGSFYNTSYKGNIYENFNNLTIDFKYYISSNNSQSLSKLYIDKTYLTTDIKFATFFNSSQRQFDSIFANTYEEDYNFASYYITNDSDTGLMIYQETGSSSLSHLNLFFNEGIYISTDSLGSNEFYYIDKEGNITTGNYFVPISMGESNDYDMSGYTGVVSSFINGFSNDIVDLQVLTQDFYDSLPVIFQTFIFVLFILACIYFTFLLIKR